MTQLNEITTPQELDLLVAFTDITGYSRFCHKRSPQEVFEIMSPYYEFVGHLIEQSGGKVVQFFGDGAMIAYTEDRLNEGVLALKSLKDRGDAWLTERNMPSRHIIKAHFGPVYCGFPGTPTEKWFSMYGNTVNTAALLNANGLAITPQLFRKLDSDTRKLFKKHTPPVTYIPVEERH